MKRILKYPLEITDEQDVEMPAGADLLTAQFQDDSLMVWAVVEPDASMSVRRFRIIGTGAAIEGYPGGYLATAQDPQCGLVWHVFWS